MVWLELCGAIKARSCRTWHACRLFYLHLLLSLCAEMAEFPCDEAKRAENSAFKGLKSAIEKQQAETDRTFWELIAGSWRRLASCAMVGGVQLLRGLWFSAYWRTLVFTSSP